MKTIALIGLGTMGPGIAATLARAGLHIRATDQSRGAMDGFLSQVDLAWAALDQLESPTTGSKNHISMHTSIADAVSGVELAIENVSENLQTKRTVFAELDQLTEPGCVLASDTSGIPITDLQQGLLHPQRVVGMHWSNPPHIIPMIEVIAGAQTSSAVVDELVLMIRSLGVIPIKVRKDVPGFVENRILYAVMREAVDLVEKGVIDPEELDNCVSWGIGYKLAVVGPCALLDMAGLDIYHAVASYLNQDLCDRKDVSPLVEEKTAAEHFGMKSLNGMYTYSEDDIATIRRDRIRQLVAVRKSLTEKLEQAVRRDPI